MTTPAVVVDASVVVAILIQPGAVAEAMVERIEASELHAPSHLWVEVTNVLRRRRNAGQLSAAEALIAVDGLWLLPIQPWPLEIVRDRVWRLGDNLTSYDGAYVALAEHLQSSLLTSDARLARAPGVRCDVELFAS